MQNEYDKSLFSNPRGKISMHCLNKKSQYKKIDLIKNRENKIALQA